MVKEDKSASKQLPPAVPITDEMPFGFSSKPADGQIWTGTVEVAGGQPKKARPTKETKSAWWAWPIVVCVAGGLLAVGTLGCFIALAFIGMQSGGGQPGVGQPDGGQPGGGQSGGGPPVALMKPVELFQAYNANEADADTRLTGKTVEIFGTPDHQWGRAEKGSDGHYNFSFRDSGFWLPEFAAPKPTVYVIFRDSEIPKLAALKRTDTGKIRGVCDGMVVNDPSYGGRYVRIRDAILILDSPKN